MTVEKLQEGEEGEEGGGGGEGGGGTSHLFQPSLGWQNQGW
jgi:hypothetical protein